MPSTVVVKMNTCNKTHRITASLREDGNIDIDIKSDCPNIQDYAERLKVISIEDATKFVGSKIIDPEVRPMVSVPCLCPIGVYDAAWQEIGMLSKNLCAKVGSNEVILNPEE